MRKITIILIISVVLFNDMKSQISDDSIQLSGFTLIKGKIKNFKKYHNEYSTIEISIDDWTTAFRRQCYANIDTLGEFSISFFIFNSQDVLLTYVNKWQTIFVNPNDTLKIIIDADNFPEGNQYFGKTAKASNDYIKYRLNSRSFYNNIDKKKCELRNNLSINKYTDWIDSVYYAQIKTIENYSQLNNLNNFLINWTKNDIYLSSKNEILSYYFKHHELKNLDTSFINSINFKDSTLRFNSAFSRIINGTSALLATYSFNNCAFLNNNLSKKIASSDVEKKEQTNQPIFSNEYYQNELFKCYIQSANVLNNNLLKQLVIVHRYFSLLEEQNIDVGLESVLNEIDDYRIKASVISKFNDYEFRQGNLNSLKILNPGSQLLNKLIDKFHGNVLYIDFWGTWCTPCYSQMKMMKNIEKDLKNEKVVFIYLCCKCQKDKWEKTIKESEVGGEHIFLTSEEYAYLSRQFNIVSVPTYIIIDKKGKIVNERAPYPMQKSLLDTIRKYLRN